MGVSNNALLNSANHANNAMKSIEKNTNSNTSSSNPTTSSTGFHNANLSTPTTNQNSNANNNNGVTTPTTQTSSSSSTTTTRATTSLDNQNNSRTTQINNSNQANANKQIGKTSSTDSNENSINLPKGVAKKNLMNTVVGAMNINNNNANNNNGISCQRNIVGDSTPASTSSIVSTQAQAEKVNQKSKADNEICKLSSKGDKINANLPPNKTTNNNTEQSASQSIEIGTSQSNQSNKFVNNQSTNNRELSSEPVTKNNVTTNDSDKNDTNDINSSKRTNLISSTTQLGNSNKGNINLNSMGPDSNNISYSCGSANLNRATSVNLANRDQHSMKNNNFKTDSFTQHQTYGSYQPHHNMKTPNQIHHLQMNSHNQLRLHPNQTTNNNNNSNNNVNTNNSSNNHHNNNNEQLSKTNLYIRGLNADTNDSDLFALCSRFGPIVSTKAILDKNTNKCKGYGFVDFETTTSAELAVTELQKQGVLVHMAKQQEADPTNLYIANLPPLMTEPELEALLQPYGRVVSTRILINQNRQPRGVGFARMETKEQCDAIIASLNGQIVKNAKEPVLIKFADGASKKRVHHFQHKPLGGGGASPFMSDHLWRNSGNDSNYHMINSGTAENRNFQGPSFDHNRPNQNTSHPLHNNNNNNNNINNNNNNNNNNNSNVIPKHQQLMNSMPSYHSHHQVGHHGHPSGGHHGHHGQHNQSQMLQHHVHNHSSHSSHRNQNQAPYPTASNFPMSGSMNATNDGSQWLHPPQAGQPYMLQAQMMAVSSTMNPSMHYLNLANQMQGMQIGNPAVSGYLSPPQWPQWPLWPSGVGVKPPSGNTQSSNQGGTQSSGTATSASGPPPPAASGPTGYNDTD